MLPDNIFNAPSILSDAVDTGPASELFAGLHTELKIEPRSEVRARPSSIDLRQFCSAMDNQGATSYCTAYAAAGCAEIYYNRSTGATLNLSEWYLFGKYNKYNSWLASQAVCSNWQIPEAFQPDFTTTPKPGFEQQKIVALREPRELPTLESALDHLAKGLPIIVSVGLDSRYWRNTVIPLSGSQNGAHAVAGIGYSMDSRFAGGGAILIKNSWGNVGDAGYQYIPFAYFTSGKFWVNFIGWSSEFLVHEQFKQRERAKVAVNVTPRFSYMGNGVKSVALVVDVVGLASGEISKIESVKWDTQNSVVWNSPHSLSLCTNSPEGARLGTVTVKSKDGSVQTSELRVPKWS